MLLYNGCAHARDMDASLPVDAECTFWRLRHQHPVCVYQDRTLDFAARKLSDFVTRTQLHGLEIYCEFFRPYGVEYELDVGLPAAATHTKVFLFSRQNRDFTERERLLLDLLRPHFVSLYASARNRRVLAALEAHEDPTRLVMLDRSGVVDFTGPGARQLFHHYFGTVPDRRLPEVVQEWLRQDAARLNRDDSLPHVGRRPLTVVRDGRRLAVQRLGDLLLLREEVASLTPREREILDLVAEGNSNAEIAASLWLSTGTVRIHLQHIYEKLGVANRTAAVARVRQIGRADTE
jgi:DNA-binding CsgD family transcriptional regulator